MMDRTVRRAQRARVRRGGRAATRVRAKEPHVSLDRREPLLICAVGVGVLARRDLAWLWYKPAAWAEASAGLGELLLVRNCALLVGATLVGFLGLSFQTRGYQLEQAARASVMTVLEIPFAYVLQYALFHEELSLLGLLGVVVVCSATVLNLVRRQQLNDAAAS